MWAKSMLSCIQMNLEAEPEIGDYGKKEFPMRNSQEQADLFLKAGYDALVDTSRTNQQAVMNEREPNQVAFLTKNAFRVIEVIQLRWKEKPFRGLTSFAPEEETHGRKLAAMIFTALGDRLVASKREGLFWSDKGKRLKISFERPASYYKDRKIGEKKHKEYKLHGGYKTIVEFERSEKGRMHRVFGRNEKFKDIVSDILWSWTRREDDPNFKPDTREEYEAGVKRARDAEIQRNIEAERKRSEAANKELKPVLKKLGKFLGLPFNIKRGVNYEQVVSGFLVQMHHRGYNADTKEDIDEVIRKIDEDGEKFLAAEEDDDLDWFKTVDEAAKLGYLSPSVIKNRPDLRQLRDILHTLYRLDPHQTRFSGMYIVNLALQNLKKK